MEGGGIPGGHEAVGRQRGGPPLPGAPPHTRRAGTLGEANAGLSVALPRERE